MKTFVFEAMPSRVVFAPNAIEHLPREIEQLGGRRALVLSTPQQEALARHALHGKPPLLMRRATLKRP